MFLRWSELIIRRARLVLALGILATIFAGVFGVGVFEKLGQGGFDDPASEASTELEQERDAFGNKSADVIAIYRSDDLTVTDPAFKAEVEETIAEIPDGTTTSVTTYWETRDPSMVSTDKRATTVTVSLAGDDQAEMADINDKVVPALESDELETDIAGPWAVYKGVNETVSEDLARAETLSLPLVIILSLLIFGSVVASLMPAVVGAIAVLGALAVVRMITGFTEVSVFSINVITLLGTGLAIDYALFVVSRFREELARLPEDDPEASAKAIRVTMATAGRTVLFSGLTVAAAMSSLLIFPQNFLRSLGYGGIAAVIVAVIAATTVLPAILVLLGRRIDAGRLPWRRHRPVSVESDHGAWARLANAVMRRPLVVMVIVVTALLVIAAPFLGVKWGSVDYRVLPPDSPAHVAAEKLNTEFGQERSSANLLLETTDRADVAAYTADVKDVDGVVDVRSVAQDEDVTLLRASWTGNSQTQESQDTVRAIREVPGPDGENVLVGGLTADTVDLLTSLESHLPWMGLIIAAVMLVLLFLAFGSLVLPVKAIAMNLFSITASFGVITWIFADGHLENALGFTSTGFLDATQPIFMLAILVGLSMDYEVFLLSRIREQWDLTHDNTLAVATGVQRTGRIITSAALLLAVVIGAFSTSGVVFMKMIGIGMLVALLIDATVVRSLLVPATMKLLGNWNWWAPAGMRRWWERYGIRESDGVPAPSSPPPGARVDEPVG